MMALRFAPPQESDGVMLRQARFEAVTTVKLAAVCEIANSACNVLSRLFDRPLEVDVFEPVVVPPASHPALFADALVYRGHGHRCDLLIVFRDEAARHIIAFAFGEPVEAHEGEISALEEQVLERVARDLAYLCTPLCGDLNAIGRSFARMEQLEVATYFELRVGPPLNAVIGIALSKEPAEPAVVPVTPAHLKTVELELRAQLARTRMTAREVMRLGPGSVVTFATKLSDRGRLIAGRRTVATGDCGAVDGTTAFFIQEVEGEQARAGV